MNKPESISAFLLLTLSIISFTYISLMAVLNAYNVLNILISTSLSILLLDLVAVDSTSVSQIIKANICDTSDASNVLDAFPST